MRSNRTDSGRGFSPARIFTLSFHTALRRLVGGRVRHSFKDYSMQVPFSYDVEAKKNRKIAAVCHIFYVELAGEMLEYLNHLPENTDIFISTSDFAKAREINRIFLAWKKGQVDIRIVPNQGRDIAPKFVTFRDVYREGYEAVLFLHSKRTTFAEFGDRWRETLLQTLAGSQKTVNSILETFDLNPRLGMVIPQHFEPVRQAVNWQDNLLMAMQLSKRMGFALKRSYILDFPAGSMFWARPEALRPLLKANLTVGDFEEEKGQITGTAAHAIERLLLYICEHAGYGWIKIADPAQFEFRKTIVPAANRSDVKLFVQNHGVSLFSGEKADIFSRSRKKVAITS